MIVRKEYDFSKAMRNPYVDNELKGNQITSYYLDYLFLFKENQKKFQSLYNEHKKNNNKS